ncbi:MAG: glycosyltransferase family 1 protein, partial [Patescibacteria group bacterium]
MTKEIPTRRAIDIRMLGRKRTGDETVFFELTREILRQDYEHEYRLLTNETDGEALALLYTRLGLQPEDTKRKIVVLPTSNRFWWNLVTLPVFLWKEKITLFHTQYILPFWVPSFTKVIDHIHDVSFCSLPQFISKKDLFFLRLLIPRSLRMSTHIVVPSQFTKDEVIKYYGIREDKIVVIPNALGSQFLANHNTRDSDETIRDKYGLPDSFLLYVGTLQPRKNIPFLIKAFTEYRARFPESQLVIVGNREGHHVDRGITEAAGVVFPGYIDETDLPRVFHMASVFVFPSLYEGFGIPILEAISQSVPVIASDIPCFREIGGEAVLYFDPRNVDSLLQALYSLEDSFAKKAELVALGQKQIGHFS